MAQASNLPDSERLFFESVQFSKSAPKARHGFFGRNGGVSKGVYASLNCGRGSDDNPANVRDNLSLVAREIGVLEGDIVTLYQVHGDTCLYIDAPMSLEDRPQADAMITDQSGLALGVLTADCAPVLFYGQKADGTPLIGAAHAGWKGALGGVLDTTVKAMSDKGAENITACIGPCIAQISYEVDLGFVQKFEDENPENERFFMASTKEGHLMFDLAGYCAARLANMGLESVFIKDLDTYFNEEDFFSYRRATHRGEKDYGRQISVICIPQ